MVRTPLIALSVLALAMAGCSSMSEREQGTAKGAGVGAAAGAIIGATTGGKVGQSAVIGGAIGAVAGNLWTKRMQDKQAALERATQGTGIDVARTADNQIKVNVPSDFSFDVGQARIRPDMRPVLDEFAKNLDPAMRVTVVGHTDSTGGDRINMPLSEDRAEAVRDYISARGVAVSRITTQGHGAREPVADNNTEDGRARNRRVEIFLREPDAG